MSLESGHSCEECGSSTRNTPIHEHPNKETVCIVGSGNWGSAVAKIIGENTQKCSDIFEQQVTMWVYEEMVGNQKLTEIINTQHENVKYLPGIKLPPNILAVPDLLEAAKHATILVFVVPHQFVKGVCDQLLPLVKQSSKTIKAISLIKGMETGGKGLSLISNVIRQILQIDVSILSGANIANEVAQEQFCETTIGYQHSSNGLLFLKLFDTKYFRVSIMEDVTGVEMCGALKNVVALAAGFADGLGYGSNTKAAIIRRGMMEMINICRMYDSHVKTETFLESCGVGDLITTCFGGRNRRCAEEHVKTKKPFEVLERELLNGQKLQGTLTSKDAFEYLKYKDVVEQFPIFVNVYRIVYEGMDVSQLLREV